VEIVERAFLFAINNLCGLTTTLIFSSVQIRMKQAPQASEWRPAARNTAPDMPRLTCLVGDEFTPCRSYGSAKSARQGAASNLIVGDHDQIAGRSGMPLAFSQLRKPSPSAASGEDHCEVTVGVDPPDRFAQHRRFGQD
jgi:hypothetical protein